MKPDRDPEAVLDRLAVAIAESEEVDWDQVETTVVGRHRELVGILRDLAKVAGTYRSAEWESDSTLSPIGPAGWSSRREPAAETGGTPKVRWGHLEILGRIRGGSFGEVYRARDPHLEMEVALKLLAPELSADEAFRERFLRESRLAAAIDHPNVIPIYEAGEADGTLFIAMRYVEGTDLGLFSPGAAISKVHAPRAAAAGCVVIDNTSQFRMDEQVPLVVPEVNPEALERFRERNIIANPNCSTIQMVMALKPLHDLAIVKRVVVATYQSVSGGGREAMDELFDQTKGIYETRTPEPKVFPKQIAFNVIPRIGQAVTGDREAYRYLVESIRRFPKPKALAAMMEAAGFRRVSFTPITGGVVALHSGWKL